MRTTKRPLTEMLNGDGVPSGEHGVPVVPRQPSSITSKSLAVSDAKAGFRMSLFHRGSNVPLTYISEPLSATINPYRWNARKMRWTAGW